MKGVWKRSAVAMAAVGLVGAAVPASAASTGPAQGSQSQTQSPPKQPNVTCHSGQILTGFFGNVTVAQNNYCELLQAVVEGNVVANGATQLGIDHSVITGSVTVNNITDNGWICGSQIAGAVTIQHSRYNPDTTYSPGTWDIGDPSPFGSATYCGNTSFDQVPGNVIEGELTFDDNASGGAISDNDIERALECTGNAPPLTGSGNAVDGPNTGQCSSFGGAADDDTTSPGDND
jgi:hypothetical protein